MVTSEYTVYSTLVDYLLRSGWDIVCACPPSGIDYRFQKCNLPRPGGLRGVRDEVDITAVKDGCCLLIECKGSLNDSTSRVNRDGDSDVQKLQRISASYPAPALAVALRQAHGYGHAFTSAQTAVAFGSPVQDPLLGVDATIAVVDGFVRFHTSDADLTAVLHSDP